MTDPSPRQISRYEMGTGKPWRRNVPSVSYNQYNVSSTPTFVGVPTLDEILRQTDLIRPMTDINIPALAIHKKPSIDHDINKGGHHYELVRIGGKAPAMICYCRECQSHRQVYLLKKTNAKRKRLGKTLIGSSVRHYQYR